METNLARLLLDRFRWFDASLRGWLTQQLGTPITPARSLLFAELPEDGARQADLARAIGVSRQAINDLVRGLERDGLVETVPDPASGRSKLVRPTPRGRESVEMALRAFAAAERELRARIGDESVDALRRALDQPWGDPPGV